MPKPFDVTTKNLVDAHPGDWLTFLGLPGTTAEVLDVDLVHLEFQASRDDGLAARTLRYNVLLHVEYGLPVKSAEPPICGLGMM